MSTKRKPQSRNPAARPGDRPRAGSAGGATRAGASREPEVEAPPVSGATKGAAIGLWVVVGAGLVYGISQTAVKVVALFG